MTESHTNDDNNTQQAILNQIDVHLALEVFDDAKKKLTLLEELAPNLDQHKDELTLYVGEEIQRIIHSQQALESDFSQLVLQRDRKQLENATKAELNLLNGQVQLLAEKIRESTKELCKNLKENPTVTENLVKTQQHRSDLLQWIKSAITELNLKNSYLSLETEIQQRYMVHQEQQKLQQKELEARERVKAMQLEIETERKRHENEVKTRNTELNELKQALFYQKDRAENTIKLFEVELKSGGDEAQRERKIEIELQLEKCKLMIQSVSDESKSQEILFNEINSSYNQMSNLSSQTMQSQEGIISVLTTQKQLLEQERSEKSKKISDLEDEDMRNQSEKKEWEDEQSFLLRMKQAVQKTREMRSEGIRGFVIEKMVEALDPPELKKKKGKKGKK
ncbi:hypothetical protein SS50377_21654 [Spironucleus salmonicida]|uniref:Dynein regulatory complex protein 9 n=1 Tax=Spironucleus salmonicida TaxID=348837 RepID=V6LL71_9EUKA|nr:hypothetical protein SS50377_21654 [Spironucleus salmonicida]|eukprot:EST45380.1 hypothetical protein SS50377_14711 [Spironucleus salmonicida]